MGLSGVSPSESSAETTVAPPSLVNDGATVCCLDDVEILINQAVCFIRAVSEE